MPESNYYLLIHSFILNLGNRRSEFVLKVNTRTSLCLGCFYSKNKRFLKNVLFGQNGPLTSLILLTCWREEKDNGKIWNKSMVNSFLTLQELYWSYTFQQKPIYFQKYRVIFLDNFLLVISSWLMWKMRTKKW